MKVMDIMSKDVVVLDIDSEIYELGEAMKKYDIGFIPISENKKIVGVITDRDVAIRGCSNEGKTLKDYITRDVIFIEGNSDVLDALNLMGKEKVKRLLVTSDDKVIGVVSLSDLYKVVDNERLIDTFKRIFEIDRNEHTFPAQIDEFYL